MSVEHRTRITERTLIAGDGDELIAVQQVLDALPSASYGRVFIEVPDHTTPVVLRTPARMTVTVLSRASRRTASGAVPERGEALAPAIAAWVSEWMPGEDESDIDCVMWLGDMVEERVTATQDHRVARFDPR